MWYRITVDEALPPEDDDKDHDLIEALSPQGALIIAGRLARVSLGYYQ
jgi:hypothetical protein